MLPSASAYSELLGGNQLTRVRPGGQKLVTFVSHGRLPSGKGVCLLSTAKVDQQTEPQSWGELRFLSLQEALACLEMGWGGGRRQKLAKLIFKN